jgi:hypothetical protein
MANGTIVFVHGTGVRLRDYKESFSTASATAKACGINRAFIQCLWGDPLGAEFEGKSLPDPPTREQIEEQEIESAEWDWLFARPLAELSMLTTRDSMHAVDIPLGEVPEWEQLWNTITAYSPSRELEALLMRGGLAKLWPRCWDDIIHAPQLINGTQIPKLAFEASAQELPEVSRALARSLVAQLYVLAKLNRQPGPNKSLRRKLVDRLMEDWHQHTLGVRDFFLDLMMRAGTTLLRERRSDYNEAIVPAIGDILLYQARGNAIRDFIRKTVEEADPPVALVAHSLGGIACFDLLALPNPPRVENLVTLGSQVPLLYEIGSLLSVQTGHQLPAHFPPWLNAFDRNDFLSFVAAPQFPKAVDFEVESGLPFPNSHGAYVSNEALWSKIKIFLATSIL